MKSITQLLAALAIASAPAFAQPPARPGPPAAPPPAAEAPQKPETLTPPDPPGQPVNLRFDVTIVDESGAQTSRKAISVTVADRETGVVRAAVFVPGLGEVPVSLDVRPALGRDGKIRTRMVLEYRPNPGTDAKSPGPNPASMRLSFGVLLESGQKIVAAQAADPVTDRRVSVEVTATILK